MTFGRTAVCLLVLLVVGSRLAHWDLVWVEEAYGMAAGAEVLRGKMLYRDVWFDKPPLYALYYAAFGAKAGLPLRLAGAALVLACCGIVGLFAQKLWGRREGVAAAAFTAVGLVFWIPSAVMAVAPDLLMMVPHMAAVFLAWRGKPLLSGVMAGVATLCNSKGVLVLAACAVFDPRGVLWMTGGWAAVQGMALLVIPAGEYWRQVWQWGFAYGSAAMSEEPWKEGLRRTLNWAGFHCALVAAAGVCAWRERNWRMAAWLGIAAIGVVGGLRFFPRYYFFVLPVVALMAGRGLLLVTRAWRWAIVGLCLVPVVRFSPTYVRAVRGSANWSDTAMMEDSRAVGSSLRSAARPGVTVFVWGYRPDVYVFSGLAAGTRFLDSQPLTGVLADRHLRDSRPTMTSVAMENRRELAQTQPTFVVDGLGLLNPELGLDRFSDLQRWLGKYEVVMTTKMSKVYRLKSGTAD